MSKLIIRIPGSCILISSLPGSALRTLVESLDKSRDVNKPSQSLVNLISNDTHLVFSMYKYNFFFKLSTLIWTYYISDDALFFIFLFLGMVQENILPTKLRLKQYNTKLHKSYTRSTSLMIPTRFV